MTPDWSNFLVAETGAAAALAGLIFVAVSLNLAKILEYPGVSGRAGEALCLLMGVVLVGTFGLAPNQSIKWLGIEVLSVGAVLWLITVTFHLLNIVRQSSKHRRWWWMPTRVLICQCATLSFCIAGILLIEGNPSGMKWLLPACIFSFIASTTSAWVLLVEINR
jgi:hypothetical protein